MIIKGVEGCLPIDMQLLDNIAEDHDLYRVMTASICVVMASTLTVIRDGICVRRPKRYSKGLVVVCSASVTPPETH